MRIGIGVLVVVCLVCGTVLAEEGSRTERRGLVRPGTRVLGPASAEPGMAAKPPAAPMVSPGAGVHPVPVPVVPAKDGDRRHERMVMRLRSAPAAAVANTINQLLGAEGKAVPSAMGRSVVIVPDMVSNSLVIGGPPDAVREVGQLVEQLDHPAAMVRLEVAIAEAPASGAQGAGKEEKAEKDEKAQDKKDTGKAEAELRLVEKPEQMEIVTVGRVTTLDNQPAYVQAGRREPRIVGTTSGQFGRSNQVTLENIGTIINMTPRVGPDGAVTVEINLEDSRFGALEEGAVIHQPAEGEPVRSPSVDTMVGKTTVRIMDGQTIVLGGLARQAKEGKERVILVTARVLRVGT